MHVHATAWVRSEDDLKESILFFLHEDQTQVVKLGGGCLYLLSHLNGHNPVFWDWVFQWDLRFLAFGLGRPGGELQGLSSPAALHHHTCLSMYVLKTGLRSWQALYQLSYFSILCLWFSSCFCFETGSIISDWPWTYYVAKGNLELLILLPLCP